MITSIQNLIKRVKNFMEKRFRNDDGVELTATNEIQAAAYENEGYKSVSKAKSKVADTEFASEFNPSALEVSARHDATANATTNATQGAQAQPTANSFDTEFSQELNMDQVQAQQDAQAQAQQTASKTARKTNK
jgi:Tol biopolymer transport system component